MITLHDMPEQIRQTIQAHRLLDPQAFTDEPLGSVKQAMPRINELVMNSLSELAGQPEGRDQLWHLAQEAAHPAADTDATVITQQGDGLVKSILADRYHGTVHTVATANKIRPASVAKLLDTATAAALEVLGGLVAEQHWSAAQLAQWLRPHQTEPVSMPLVADTNFAPSATVASVVGASPWLAKRSNWLLAAVSIIAVAEMGYILGMHSAAADAAVATTTVPAEGGRATDVNTSQPASTNRQYTAIPVANLTSGRVASATTVPVPVVLKLKNGVRQVIGANSTESKLYQFLIDPSKEIDGADPTRDWIGFDRIYFDSNKATLTNESLWQLSNVASILKRFPDAKIKIGGYTDNSGRPLTNLGLSKARAQAALEALVGLGVPANRLTAVGYGELDNIASNDTEEGRSVNRRVSMQVVQK